MIDAPPIFICRKSIGSMRKSRQASAYLLVLYAEIIGDYLPARNIQIRMLGIPPGGKSAANGTGEAVFE